MANWRFVQMLHADLQLHFAPGLGHLVPAGIVGRRRAELRWLLSAFDADLWGT